MFFIGKSKYNDNDVGINTSRIVSWFHDGEGFAVHLSIEGNVVDLDIDVEEDPKSRKKQDKQGLKVFLHEDCYSDFIKEIQKINKQ